MVNRFVRCLSEIKVCNTFYILLISLNPREEYLNGEIQYAQEGSKPLKINIYIYLKSYKYRC